MDSDVTSNRPCHYGWGGQNPAACGDVVITTNMILEKISPI
jgi:hypothetical protein